MRKIKVVSQKYNGALRDEGESYLYHADETTIIAVTPPGTPYFHHKKGAWFTTEDGSIDLYFIHQWYNVWHICEQATCLRHRAQRAPAMKIFGRGFPLSDADLFLSATIRVDPRPIFTSAPWDQSHLCQYYATGHLAG